MKNQKGRILKKVSGKKDRKAVREPKAKKAKIINNPAKTLKKVIKSPQSPQKKKRTGIKTRIGDLGITPQRRAATPVKTSRSSTIPSNSKVISKSPKFLPLIKKKILKEKSAGRIGQNKTQKRRIERVADRREKRRDFIVAIETPIKSRVSRTPSRSVTPSKVKVGSTTQSRNITPSKTKERMQNLTRVKEEDDFLREVRRQTPKRESSVKKSQTKSPLKLKPVAHLKTKSPVAIKPVETRTARHETTQKSLDHAMRSIEKVRLTPKKLSVSKSPVNKSLSKNKKRERSRKEEIKVELKSPVVSKSKAQVKKSPSMMQPRGLVKKSPAMIQPTRLVKKSPTVIKQKIQVKKSPVVIKPKTEVLPVKRSPVVIKTEAAVKKYPIVIKPKAQVKKTQKPFKRIGRRLTPTRVELTKKSVDEAMRSVERVKLTQSVSKLKKVSTSKKPSVKKEEVHVQVQQTKIAKVKELSKTPEKTQKKKVSISKKAAVAKKSVIPVRTPTKKFKKEKTPSPETEEEVEEEESESSKEEINIKSKNLARRGAIVDMAIKKEKVIKEEPSSEEEEESSSKKKTPSDSETKKAKVVKKPVRHQLNYKVDTRGISEEISKILKKIEEKKRKGGETTAVVKESKKKRKVEAEKRKVKIIGKKPLAIDYNYKLQTNPNIKTEHIVKISDIVEKPTKTTTDVLLTILELASNAEYYNFSYSNNSKLFWEDVVQYEQLKEIFEDFKGETLKKYWHTLSTVGDVNKIADLVKKHKTFLDGIRIKLLPVISALRDYFTGKITDFEDSVLNMKVEVRHQETFEEEEVDPITGEVTKIKVKKMTTKLKNKFEQEKEKKQKVWQGRNYSGNPDEVFGITPPATQIDSAYHNFIKRVEEEEKRKFEFLNKLSEEEKVKLLSINEEDKFLFRIIDNIVTKLQTQFPQFTKNYIIEVLNGNSMNIEKSYQFLSDPIYNSKIIFNDADDKVILEMKNSEAYVDLSYDKGINRVEEREDYLLA